MFTLLFFLRLFFLFFFFELPIGRFWDEDGEGLEEEEEEEDSVGEGGEEREEEERLWESVLRDVFEQIRLKRTVDANKAKASINARTLR